MKVLFLDFDGVLNSQQFLRGKRPIESLKRSGFKSGDKFHQIQKIDHTVVSLLHQFVEKNNVHIVFSTAWREAFSQSFLTSLLQSLSPINDRHFIGITPSLGIHRKRGDEVGAWLKNNPVSQFVIFDDMETNNFLRDQQPFHIRTDYKVGLTLEQIAEATCLINRQ